MTPALQAIRQAIQDQITTNHNGEITGAILNPILVGMITALVDSIGDIEHLNTENKDDLVSAVNELQALIQTLEPIKKFTGVGDPNLNPPTGANIGDLYYQMDGGAIVDVWQYIEIRWVSLDTSVFVRKAGESLVSSDFTLKSKVGNSEGSVKLNGFNFSVTSKDSDEGWNSSFLYNAEEGLFMSFGDGNSSIYIHPDEIGGGGAYNFRLGFPNTHGNMRFIPVSVNGEYADANGNIEITGVGGDYLKKDESNTVTEDFEITDGTSVLSFDADGYVDIDAEGIVKYTFKDDGINIHSPNYATTVNVGGINSDVTSGGVGWGLNKNTSDTEKSFLYLPQTGETERRLAISVNNEFADENGNIELDYISETEKGQPDGVATLDADGHIPTDQLPTKAMTIEGEWDASTNTPHLEDGVGNDGMVYVCQVAGTVDFGDGDYEFKVGDWAVYGANGKWFRAKNSNEVTSVNGKRGDVILDASDVGALDSSDPRIADWDDAYSYSQVGHVPYTGANQPINFGTQDFTQGGKEVKLATHFERTNLVGNGTGGRSFVLLSNVASRSELNSTDTADIIITLPITASSHFQATIDVMRGGFRARLIVGAFGVENSSRFVQTGFGRVDAFPEVKFGRIGNSTVLILKRTDSTLNRLQVNISEFYYHHTVGSELYNNKENYKVEYIKEEDLVGLTLNGTVLNKDFVRDPFYLDYNNLTNKPIIDPTLQDATDNGNTTTNDVVLEKSMLIFEAMEEMSATADSSNGWFWYGAGAKDDAPFYWNFRRGGDNESVNSFYFQDNDHQIITFPFQESDGSAVVAYQEWVNNKRKIYELDALVLDGDFDEELFDVCPTDLDTSFITWDITWVDNGEHCSVKQEYFTKADTPLRLTTAGSCLAIRGNCSAQIDIPTGAKLVLNYA